MRRKLMCYVDGFFSSSLLLNHAAGEVCELAQGEEEKAGEMEAEVEVEPRS